MQSLIDSILNSSDENNPQKILYENIIHIFENLIVTGRIRSKPPEQHETFIFTIFSQLNLKEDLGSITEEDILEEISKHTDLQEPVEQEVKLYKGSEEYLRVINFIYSSNFQYFLKILPENQQNIFNLFLSYPLEVSTQRGFFRNIANNLKEAESFDNVFKSVLYKIYDYLNYLEKNINTTKPNFELFNYQTAPYFWREQIRANSSAAHYQALTETSHSLIEYINLMRLETVLTSNKWDANLKIIYFLHFKGKEFIDIAEALKLEKDEIAKGFKKVSNSIYQNFFLRTEAVIKFLELKPTERAGFFLCIRDNLSPREIANYLEIALSTAQGVSSKINTTYQKNNLSVRGERQFTFNPKMLYRNDVEEPYRSFIPNEFKIETKGVEELVIDYCMDPNSIYKEGMLRLLQKKEIGLIYLYLLLCEVPDIECISTLTKYAKNTLITRIAELKKFILEESNPSLTHEGLDWIEIEQKAKPFLLNNGDLRVLNSIKHLNAKDVVLSTAIIATFSGENTSTTYYRLRKIREIFEISESIGLSEFPKIVGVEKQEQ